MPKQVTKLGSYYETVQRILGMIFAQAKNDMKPGGSLATVERLLGKVKCEGLNADDYVAAVIVSNSKAAELPSDRHSEETEPSIELKKKGFVMSKDGISFNRDASLDYNEIVVFTSGKIFTGTVGK